MVPGRRGAVRQRKAEVDLHENGIGFDPLNPSRVGRWLPSLHTRARRVGGEFTVECTDPGMRMVLRFPLASTIIGAGARVRFSAARIDA